MLWIHRIVASFELFFSRTICAMESSDESVILVEHISSDAEFSYDASDEESDDVFNVSSSSASDPEVITLSSESSESTRMSSDDEDKRAAEIVV